MKSIYPHSLEAEKGLIGSMLIDPRLIAAAVKFGIRPGSFFHPPHGTIFTVLTRLSDNGTPVDFVHITTMLQDDGNLANIGGAVAITKIQADTPTAVNWKGYAIIVLEKAERRKMMKDADLLRELAASEGETIDVVREAAQAIGMVASRAMVANSDVQHAKQPAMEFMDAVQAAAMGEDKRYRIDTGLPTLDRLTHGLPPGNMVIVGAQTSVGKTALGLQIASGPAFHETDRRPTMVVSLEMTAKNLAGRLTAARSGVSLGVLHSQRPLLTEMDYSRLESSMRQILGSELYIWTPEKTPTAAEVAAMIRMQKMLKPELALVVVDYIQLLAPANGKDSRERQVSEMCETLMRCAVSTGVTIVGLSQLNDEGRLRDSRAIGHHARIVAIITRPDDEQDKGERTLFLYKNSEGQAQVGFDMHFDGAHQTFKEVHEYVGF